MNTMTMTRKSSLAVALIVAMAIAPWFSVLAADSPEVTAAPCQKKG